MAVSTTVQVQIGELLAHCTVEVVLDVPSSAILPREVTSFCSKVTSAVINAANDARAEHAASVKVAPAQVCDEGKAHLPEPREQSTAPKDEEDERPRQVADAESNIFCDGPSASERVSYRDALVDGQADYIPLNDGNGKTALDHQQVDDRDHIKQNFQEYLKRRDLHEPTDSAKGMPLAKKLKVEQVDRVNENNPVPQPGGYKKKSKGKKGKNKQKRWQKLQMQDSKSHNLQILTYPYPCRGETNLNLHPLTSPVDYRGGGYLDSYHPASALSTQSAPSYASYAGSSYSAPTQTSYSPAPYSTNPYAVPAYGQTLFSAPPAAPQPPNWWDI